MRSRFIKLCLLVVIVGGMAVQAEAQTKRPSSKRPTTTKKKTTTNKNSGNNNAVVNAPAKDTAKPVAQLKPEIKLDTIRKSLRTDDIYERNLVKDRTPLTYEHLREDDIAYRQRLWRGIDVRDKMNLPFVYKADDQNGNQRFINILLQAIKSQEITAFSPIDDRFTTPYTMDEITRQFVGEPIIQQVPDWAKDPDGSKGLTKDSLIINEYNPDMVQKYMIKEDIVFDKESSRMHVRILGIAPLKTIMNPDGSFRAVTPMFWVYYPDLRPLLAKYEAYNGKNYGARMSWEELFESRMFISRIVKSTVENPYDLFIEAYIKDPILRLLEGENIKEKIFNYEQDLWSY